MKKKKLVAILPGTPIFREQNPELMLAQTYSPEFVGSPDTDQQRLSGMSADLNLQPLHYPAMHQVFFEDFVDIFPVDIGVPDTFRVNDDYRTFFTAVETSRRIDPYTALARKSQRLAALFGVITHGLRFKPLATCTAIRALVDAEKNVITVIVHNRKIQAAPARAKPVTGRL